jgi:Ala-tRNA(Pro) deacylase
MSVIPSLLEVLDEKGISYKTEIHPYAPTAQGVAQSEHITGYRIAKTVVVRVGEKWRMLVLPAPKKVDLDAVKAHFKEKAIRLASEQELRELFPDCELGAMPPLGELYHMEVFVDENLARQPDIVFNAGSHTETIEMRYGDFARLARPLIFRFAL